MANVPTDAYWAWGLGEELIVVIPSLDLVIVRNGGQATANPAPASAPGTTTTGMATSQCSQPFLDPIVAGDDALS